MSTTDRNIRKSPNQVALADCRAELYMFVPSNYHLTRRPQIDHKSVYWYAQWNPFIYPSKMMKQPYFIYKDEAQ